MLQDAIVQATLSGWRLQAVMPHQAVLHYEQSGTNVGALMINLVLTFVTCGFWLVAWVPMLIIETLRDPGRQVLILTEDHIGNITQVVRRGA